MRINPSDEAMQALQRVRRSLPAFSPSRKIVVQEMHKLLRNRRARKKAYDAAWRKTGWHTTSCYVCGVIRQS